MRLLPTTRQTTDPIPPAFPQESAEIEPPVSQVNIRRWRTSLLALDTFGARPRMGSRRPAATVGDEHRGLSSQGLTHLGAIRYASDGCSCDGHVHAGRTSDNNVPDQTGGACANNKVLSAEQVTASRENRSEDGGADGDGLG
jgi:hypothetical protein